MGLFDIGLFEFDIMHDDILATLIFHFLIHRFLYHTWFSIVKDPIIHFSLLPLPIFQLHVEYLQVQIGACTWTRHRSSSIQVQTLCPWRHRDRYRCYQQG